ncbi:hypothetical protein JCM10207_008329 [Rhodosporidiobolus poonsookiae]
MRRYLPTSLLALAVPLFPLSSGSSLAVASPIQPRGPVTGAGISFIDVSKGEYAHQPAVRRSDDAWLCNPLEFSVSFLRAPASVTAISAPTGNNTYNILETLAAEMEFPTTLRWTVDLPVGTRFAIRVEDASGAAALSMVRKVERAGYPYLADYPECRKREPNWVDRNRGWLDVCTCVLLVLTGIFFLVLLIIVGPAALFQAVCAPLVWIAAGARQLYALLPSLPHSKCFKANAAELAQNMRARVGRRGGSGVHEEIKPDMDDDEGEDDKYSVDGTASLLSEETQETV